MLLRELDQSEDFVAELENMLSVLQQSYDKHSSPAQISYKALNLKLQKSGIYGAINQSIMQNAIDKSEVLANLIKNYDGNGIELTTQADRPEDTDQPQPDLEKTDQGISKTTQQAASRAASSTL
jgi:hypothetical protein